MPGASAECPCGAGSGYDSCCGIFHSRTKNARTAEELMRSRYSAYVVGDAAYLLWSWHPDTRPAAIDLDEARSWLGLKITETAAGDALDTTGIVEFEATFVNSGQDPMHVHERSTFGRVDGRWVYVDGVAGQDAEQASAP